LAEGKAAAYKKKGNEWKAEKVYLPMKERDVVRMIFRGGGKKEKP